MREGDWGAFQRNANTKIHIKKLPWITYCGTSTEGGGIEPLLLPGHDFCRTCEKVRSLGAQFSMLNFGFGVHVVRYLEHMRLQVFGPDDTTPVLDIELNGRDVDGALAFGEEFSNRIAAESDPNIGVAFRIEGVKFIDLEGGLRPANSLAVVIDDDCSGVYRWSGLYEIADPARLLVVTDLRKEVFEWMRISTTQKGTAP